LVEIDQRPSIFFQALSPGCLHLRILARDVTRSDTRRDGLRLLFLTVGESECTWRQLAFEQRRAIRNARYSSISTIELAALLDSASVERDVQVTARRDYVCGS
jgi:hypothetical protein